MIKHSLKIGQYLMVILFLSSCGEDFLPKPKAFLRLSYENTDYQLLESNCPYTFEYSSHSELDFKSNCWLNIHYPKLKATVNITYRPIIDNLRELLLESEKLTYKHASKAEGISTQPYINEETNKFGGLSEVTGNAASPLQFHLTDSTKHFITGALYFNVRPNYDSILPAIKYIEKDLGHLMESLSWKEPIN